MPPDLNIEQGVLPLDVLPRLRNGPILAVHARARARHGVMHENYQSSRLEMDSLRRQNAAGDALSCVWSRAWGALPVPWWSFDWGADSGRQGKG